MALLLFKYFSTRGCQLTLWSSWRKCPGAQVEEALQLKDPQVRQAVITPEMRVFLSVNLDVIYIKREILECTHPTRARMT